MADSLTLARVVDPSWAQVPVANDPGYFKQHGVNVKIVPFPTGAAALEALAAARWTSPMAAMFHLKVALKNPESAGFRRRSHLAGGQIRRAPLGRHQLDCRPGRPQDRRASGQQRALPRADSSPKPT